MLKKYNYSNYFEHQEAAWRTALWLAFVFIYVPSVLIASYVMSKQSSVFNINPEILLVALILSVVPYVIALFGLTVILKIRVIMQYPDRWPPPWWIQFCKMTLFEKFNGIVFLCGQGLINLIGFSVVLGALVAIYSCIEFAFNLFEIDVSNNSFWIFYVVLRVLEALFGHH